MNEFHVVTIDGAVSIGSRTLASGPSIIGQKSTQEHVSEAYACLAMQQTSLSPSVHALLTQSIPLALAPAACTVELLRSDMTLNWQGVEKLLPISPETGSHAYDCL